MYYVDVIQSVKNKKIYTGYSSNLKSRLLSHNKGLNYSTKFDIPWKLLYYEASLHEKDARAREKYLKSGMGKRYWKNRLKHQLLAGL